MKKRKNKPLEHDGNFISLRLNILFSIVIFLFLVLILRLADMQIINHDFYSNKLSTASQKIISNGSIRGQIYDAQGKPLVENEIQQVVSFTRSNKMSAQEMKEVANKLLQWVNVSDVTITQRDKADYYLADEEVYRQVVEALPEDKKYDSDGNYLSESTIYSNAVDSIPAEALQYSEQDSKAIELFKQMNGATYFSTVNLVTDTLTAEQVAHIVANESQLPGISTTNNWQRTILPTSLSSIIGTVTSEQAGLPAEDAEYYLSKGYSSNDRVGTAYLEKQYEEVLQGQREKKEINLDRNGNVESIETIQEGQQGNNIKLTIDLAFQDGVNAILKKHFESELSTGSALYSEGVYAVALEPSTGAVLAMSGYSHEKGSGEITEDALGTITSVFTPGSIVKGATISSGWENGVISGNQVQLDEPIYFAGSAPLTSWWAYGSFNIDATEALEYSSNAYMVKIALGLLGQTYSANMYLNDGDTLTNAMTKLRSTFAEYGLGAPTGIDLPLESTGFLPEEYSTANFIMNAFGQFDNYTPMQMAQYVATVANNGKRISPHLVEGIYGNNPQGGLGELIETVSGKEMNQVNISAEEMSLLRQGFYQVVNGSGRFNTGSAIGRGAAVTISAKTGRAETFTTTPAGDVVTAVNTNVVAYAPSENPKIAVAVIFPNLTNLSSTTTMSITNEIINLYNSLYPMN
ncbi:penicillin-binding protein PBP2B [Streptococcus suis]|uniref:penicillin-binding protein PBP2B n=1 Tax=Streptococcus suis TaxID=1307 RepID=UPI00211BEAD1|nr:penicillin-binding protein PBP2B [Streptococcus suis]MCQ9225527.1 penicillin-binding protein PBP2B [Streptococcus suis]MCQ9227801.1 penicillin-binding protein PBP2B [Streptococcus suis]MCQ9241989.1 penicillin-binding protein PBP2B [Streptococcus suis]MCQ9274093.1 penicillin-binding protein PBP2B [Streptococcus suis]MDE7535201.1 penicillin-binding protein PBP2B [Streptococcus suis]